ncbi:P-loop ATPase, Sll1717 family [Streptomyces sp. NBC_01508]|uniref:P-loop ATPase, Sll1717 family n=1 Tax=Streptomyces sp. NBC_01508 TaxID=2903888 RepID=UPI00386CCD0A
MSEDVVRRLYFGRDDAESDITVGLLRAGFMRTAAYEEALNGRKMLVIGRKGSGKSAIRVRLAGDGDRPGGTVVITPDDAAGDELRRFELQGLTGDTAKSLIWRYVFAVHAARYLVGHYREHRRRAPGSVKALRSFLVANDEALDERLYDRLVKGARGLETSLSLEAFGVKAAMDVRGASEGSRATRQLEILESGVARAFADLDCAGRHAPLLLMVDKLEQVWSNDPDSNAMVIGLLLAAQHTAGAYGGALRCLLFLRSDIYDSLQFAEGDKFHGDEMRIDWTRSALREMAVARAQASMGPEVTPDRLWREIFPVEVGGEPTFDYVYSRALPRPRDAIQFLNLCRDRAVAGEHDRIHEEDVVEAAQQFSEWKLGDLAKEYLVNYPYLSALFEMFRNSGYVVMRSGLETRLDEMADTLLRQFPEYADGLSGPAVVESLYAVSFLGVRLGNDVVYATDRHRAVQPYENEFHIHPCFRPALNAVNAVGLHPYEPHHAASRVVNSFSPSRQSPRVGGLGVGRDFGLMEDLVRACDRILRQMSRATSMPVESRDEVAREVGRVMEDARESLIQLREGRPVDASPHVLRAVNYLESLAGQLQANGLDHETGTESVARRVQDECRRLIRMVGGSSGGSGYSNS